METNKQVQSVSEGGQAIQSARDTIINHGMSLTQMAEVMMEVRNLTEVFTAEAMKKVHTRMEEFEEEVLKHFADSTKTNAEAFRDPDFQLMLSAAQKAYARSGNVDVRETLADIIARRSMVNADCREALTLNDAAERAPRLTKEEFAALSLDYIVRYAHLGQINDAATMADYINNILMPLAKGVSREQASFWHIEAQSCGRNGIASIDISQAFRENYPGVLGLGLKLESLQAQFQPMTELPLEKILCTSVRDENLVQPNAVTKDIYFDRGDKLGFSPEILTEIWRQYIGTIPGNLPDLLRPLSPEVDFLFEVWQSTPLGTLELNSVGIAIGHANAARVVGFDAPLSMWIK